MCSCNKERTFLFYNSINDRGKNGDDGGTLTGLQSVRLEQ